MIRLMSDNAARLRELMKECKLTYRVVGLLLHVSTDTVRNWTRPQSNAAFRAMPLAYVELLEFKLGKRVAS